MESQITFPHKSRRAIIEYLKSNGGYNSLDDNYAFAWNVKVHWANFDGDSLRKHIPELDPKFDDAWDKLLEKNPGAFYRFLEDAGLWLTEGEWCTYPGDDKGDWKFEFTGRSGGWLGLVSWCGISLKGRRFYSDFESSFEEKDEWPFELLRALYRGIRIADHEFTPEKASRAVEYQAAIHREFMEGEWQAEIDDANQEAADEMLAARPDLAPTYEI